MHPRWVCERTGSLNPQVASYNLFEQNTPKHTKAVVGDRKTKKWQ